MEKSQIPESRLPFALSLLRRLPIPSKLGALDCLYQRALRNKGVVCIETSEGLIWKLDLRNSTHRWIVYGDYEGPGFIPWAKEWIRDDSVVVDSGANIGQVLLYLAPKIRTGNYIAVEPNPVARRWLKDCLAFYPQWPVKVECFGLGESRGLASLHGEGGESAVGSHGSLKKGSGEIEVRTLDDYCRQEGIEQIDLWKLDMEGGEEAALKGAQELLRHKSIKALVVETDEKRFSRDCANLKAKGYEPFDWHKKRLTFIRQNFYGNVLFLPC